MCRIMQVAVHIETLNTRITCTTDFNNTELMNSLILMYTDISQKFIVTSDLENAFNFVEMSTRPTISHS